MNHLYQDFGTLGEFLPVINKFRKANKNKWFVFIGTVEGKEVRIKNFETWLQKLEVNGLTHFAPMELSVKAWTEVITQAIGERNTNG